MGEKVIHTVPRWPCSHRLFLPSTAYGFWSTFFFLAQLCAKKKASSPLARAVLNFFPRSLTQGISLTAAFIPFSLQLFPARSYITTHWSMSKAQSKQSSESTWNNYCVYILNLAMSRYRSGMMVRPTANTKCFTHKEPFETC